MQYWNILWKQYIIWFKSTIELIKNTLLGRMNFSEKGLFYKYSFNFCQYIFL